MSDVETFSDLYDLIGNCYDTTRKASSNYEVGQIVFVPVIEHGRRLLIADVARSDPTSHTDVTLSIRHPNGNDFRGKGKRLPVKLLNLDENHEAVLSRAKLRPCLIIGKHGGVKPHTLPEGQQRNKATNAFPEVYLLSPIYSTSTPQKPTSFGPVLTARIRCLMYPNFVYLPRSGGILSQSGVLRLDHLFFSGLEHDVQPQNLFVSEHVLAICHDQLKLLCGFQCSDEYLDARKLLLDELPETYK